MYATAGAATVTVLCAVIWLTLFPPIDYSNTAARHATSTAQQEDIPDGAPPFRAIGTALAEALSGAQKAISGMQDGESAPIEEVQE